MTTYTVDAGGADIIGFNPATDKLDFGGQSVHNLIMTQTVDGYAALTNPYSNESQVLVGVTIAELSVANLGVVGNEHLREDLGGVLSWELGLGTRDADTVYIRSHETGLHTVIEDFDPATQKISFLYFGTRERLSVTDTADGLLISVQPTGQSFLFVGVTKAELVPANIEFHYDQIVEDALEVPFGWPQEAFTLVPRDALVTPAAPDGELTDGWQSREPYGEITGEGPPDITGDPIDLPNGVLTLEWEYGTHVLVDFDPATDVIDFGWFHPGEFKIAQVNNEVTIYIVGMRQAYTLDDVSLHDITLANFKANDAATLEAIEVFIDHSADHVEMEDLPNGVLKIKASHASHGVDRVIDFDPATDVIRFGTLDADLFEITEVDGSVVISLPDTEQTYTLYGVDLDSLSRANFRARDPEAKAEIRALFDADATTTATVATADDPLI